MMKFITIFHHSRDDDLDCDGDYWHITLELNGKEIVRFGDLYHDKGEYKAEAFIQGYMLAAFKGGLVVDPLEYTNTDQRIADAEY